MSKKLFPIQVFKMKLKKAEFPLLRWCVLCVNRMKNRNLTEIPIPYNVLETRNLQYQENSYLLLRFVCVALFFLAK